MIEKVLARKINLVGIDVDGTMTDGGLYIGATTLAHGGAPIELKRFDIQDGLGIVLLKVARIVVVPVTGRPSEASRMRAEELGTDAYVVVPPEKKVHAFESILHRYNTRWEEACFVGDDLPDVPIMRKVGLPVAVGNAAAEVKELAVHTTKATGGRGAIREFVETLLKARGTWDDVVRTYLREKSDVALTR